MSGIAGVFLRDGRPVDRADLEAMQRALAHRGPDGSGVWMDGSVGLGHQMLWSTPESSREKLPLTDETGSLVLVCDARIDNRDELIKALSLGGKPRGEIGDSEVILRAYEKWGENCPRRLLGDFAFALWDARKEIVFCARDHRGIKPFYYYLSRRALIFSSEIKALLGLSEVPQRLNEIRVADYLARMWEDKAITFYRDILRLPPAHTLTVSREGAQLKEYWSLDPEREIRLGSDEEYAEAFREIFFDAVRSRLRSHYPVGSMLTGGLDTSSVVGVARQILARNGGGELPTFSGVFDDDPKADERPYFSRVIAEGGVAPHYIPRQHFDPPSDLDALLKHQDEPFFIPSAFLFWTVYRVAREKGVRVVLDGVDGDSTICHGMAYLPELVSSGRWLTALREVVAYSRRRGSSAADAIVWNVIRPLAPDQLVGLWRKSRGGGGPLWAHHRPINHDFALEIGFPERYQRMMADRLRPARRAREDHYQRLTGGFYPLALEVMGRAASAFSVEPRHPCFDVRLAEFCLALPPEQRLRDGWTRAIMRRALGDVLPPEVRCRMTKSGVSHGYVKSMMIFPDGPVEEVIARNESLIGKYVDMEAVAKAHRRYEKTGEEHEGFLVWWVAALARWLAQTGLCPDAAWVENRESDESAPAVTVGVAD